MNGRKEKTPDRRGFLQRQMFLLQNSFLYNANQSP
ncbi:hypothetical protein EC836_11513 [Erwinia sp. JUb26]|nr:hypothetical protein EC836_11513 [Erwinia sp. JUb26]